MTTTNHYTFGDNARAATRLELLARAFEEPSRALLERFAPRAPRLALDLGSGPGFTTRLVHEVSAAQRTLGLEASDKYLEQARGSAGQGIELVREDITRPSGTIPAAELVFCRFVLTHVADPAAALTAFRGYLAPGGRLLLQETASMETTHAALNRYYELVARLQAHYGQTLYIGRELQRFAAGAPFSVVHAGIRRFERSAAVMAQLHLQNLMTWRADPFAQRVFDAAELNDLEQALRAVAEGEDRAQPVSLGLGELVLS
ncbi:MAG: class I SAM-dependent methyltransferase [Myxococcales bacterium]|nr:MAG: class I SAM-dependent methyltransferase [Myxococcales bacterium]